VIGAETFTSESMNVHLPSFDGPLDLLYYLIRKHELEISEVTLAVIADEFVAAVEAARELNLNIAGGFLVIAATLMYLKSKWLLPPEEEPQDGTEQEGEVGALLARLVDQQKLREVVHELAMHEDRSRATYPRPLTSELARRLDQIAEAEPFIEMSSFELLKAMRKIQEFAFQGVREIVKEEINLEDKIDELLTIVKVRLRVSLSRMFVSSRSLLEAVVFFMASLELTKQKAIRLEQKENFGELEAVVRTDGVKAAA